jgi:dTDP-4-dehydrorhamnose 3,5-epimerase
VYFPDGDRGVRWDDPTLAIDWPTRGPQLSPKDAALPLLLDPATDLPTWVP